MVTRFHSSRRAFVRSVAGASFLTLADQQGIAKGSIPLAVRGKRPYSIFLSTEASPSERWAAEELRRHVEQMTGLLMQIETASGAPTSRRAIAIGQSALTERLGIQPPQGESCLLKTAGETVIIAGGRQRGTMYGVSLFLEKLGCRWFTPDVARIPQIESLWLPEFNETHGPAFEYREVFFREAQGREWSARNRLNGHFHQLDESVGGKISFIPFAHAFYDLVPPDRYFESHPEYFAQVHGKRRRDHAQLCLTNAEVLRLATDQAERWLADHPDVSIISISQNDGGGWCECDPCRQVVKGEGAISGLALRFANQVAERLAISHPGKMVDMLAYQDTADPPSKVRPRSNVQIRLCPIDACQGHSYRTCVYNKPTRDRLERWSRIAPKLYVWQYSVNFSHYLAPFPNYDELIADIPMFHRAGVSGLFIEGAVSEGGGGDDAELRSYLAARLLWNPAIDAQGEIRDFLHAVYGPAAPLLLDYFVLRQHEVRRGEHLWIDQNVDAPYLTPEFLRRGRELLGRASRKAVSDAGRRRIDRQLLSLEYVDTLRQRRCVIQGASYGPSDPLRVNLQTEKLLKTALDLGVTNFREGFPIPEQARAWRESKTSYAALTLTQGAAEATVIPGLEGRVIALGRPNILRVPDPGEWAYPHAGGIHVTLYEGDSSAPRVIAWQAASTTPDAVTLTGTSDSALSLQMQIRIAENELHVHVVVLNPATAPTRLKLLCRAEFNYGVVREAVLTYPDRSGTERKQKIRFDDSAVDGGIDLSESDPSQKETVLTCASAALHISNHVRTEEVEQCGVSWSFRNPSGLNVDMSVESPEVELGPGQRFALTSEYRWKTGRRLP